jgi:hypothetical protein
VGYDTGTGGIDLFFGSESDGDAVVTLFNDPIQQFVLQGGGSGYLGKRWKNHTHVLFMFGNDGFVSELEDQLWNGIKENMPNALTTTDATVLLLAALASRMREWN